MIRHSAMNDESSHWGHTDQRNETEVSTKSYLPNYLRAIFSLYWATFFSSLDLSALTCGSIDESTLYLNI